MFCFSVYCLEKKLAEFLHTAMSLESAVQRDDISDSNNLILAIKILQKSIVSYFGGKISEANCYLWADHSVCVCVITCCCELMILLFYYVMYMMSLLIGNWPSFTQLCRAACSGCFATNETYRRHSCITLSTWYLQTGIIVSLSLYMNDIYKQVSLTVSTWMLSTNRFHWLHYVNVKMA